MRNALVVLVPLCFGLTSGFIVPSGIQEIITDMDEGLTRHAHRSAIKTRNMLPTTKRLCTSIIPSSVEKAASNTLDKDIYEYSQMKESDVKERAYIAINQNANRRMRNQFEENPVQISQLDKNTDKSYLLNLNKIFEDFPRQFSIGYMSENLHTDRESSKHEHRCHGMKVKQNEMKSAAHLKTQARKTFSNVQQESIQGSKNPLLKAAAKHNNKEKNNTKYLGTDNRKVESSNLFYPYASNIKGANDWIGRKNYQNSLHGDRYLLDELVKQKLGEKGSLFACQDCDKANKTRFNKRLHFEVMCKCGSNLLTLDVDKN